MKKSIPLVIIFLILLLLLELGYTLIKQDHEEKYVVDNYNVTELYKNDSYYLSIDNGTEYYKYQTDINFNKTTNIVEKILTYSVNNIKCIYPIYKENSFIRDENKYNDIECFYNGTTYTGDSLNGMVNLNAFRNTIKENNGNYKTWDYKNDNIKYLNEGNVYLLDLPNVFLTITSNDNTHLYVSNKTIGYTEDFPINNANINDSGLAGSYYVYPNARGQITSFGYVDITTGDVGEITSPYKISSNSYANGSYKNELYIYDKDASKQYKVSKVRVSESSKDNKSLYFDGEKSEFVDNSRFSNGLYFANNNDGMLKYYARNNSIYKVYNGDEVHPVIIYRGPVKGIKANKNYIMFSNDKNVYVHSDTSGVELYYQSVKYSVNENSYQIYVR